MLLLEIVFKEFSCLVEKINKKYQKNKYNSKITPKKKIKTQKTQKKIRELGKNSKTPSVKLFY